MRRKRNGAAATGGSGNEATPGQAAGTASDLGFEEANGQGRPAARGQVNAPSLAPGSGAQRQRGNQSQRYTGSGRCDFASRIGSMT